MSDHGAGPMANVGTQEAREEVSRLNNIAKELRAAVRVCKSRIPCEGKKHSCGYHETSARGRCTMECPYRPIHTDFLRIMKQIESTVFYDAW